MDDEIDELYDEELEVEEHTDRMARFMITDAEAAQIDEMLSEDFEAEERHVAQIRALRDR